MDLSTTYLGLKLKNPLVPSASPLSRNLDGMKRLEDAGASAVVMYSLFEEQIAHEAAELNHYLSYGTESFAEALTYFPETQEYNLGPEEYVELLHRAKKALGEYHPVFCHDEGGKKHPRKILPRPEKRNRGIGSGLRKCA